MDENGEVLDSERPVRSFLRGPRGMMRVSAETVALERGQGTKEKHQGCHWLDVMTS